MVRRAFLGVNRFCNRQLERMGRGMSLSQMETVASVASVRNTSREKLRPTPAQARELERVLGRGRTLYYHTARQQRITLWRQRGVARRR